MRRWRCLCQSSDASEICNSTDDDCDALVDNADPGITGQTNWYADADADGFGNAAVSQLSCDQPSGYVADGTDCDDGNAAANPDGAETCNGTDDDCNGLVDDADPGISGQPTWYADVDGDGFGDPNATLIACNQPSGYVANNTDLCALDPAKSAPGICGCGVADLDTDGDGTADCNDGCPLDPSKTVSGICGCGVADIDTDGDGTADCNDGCPLDPTKTESGICGCGVSDIDSDGDGTADCNDDCPLDPAKTASGICGCGVADEDLDGDTYYACAG
ncbi:MAG: putative metal-binding motif-containing protein [Saprospiraceae bacterium]|nr:putative metal-binding motif-containing protein [Saprospiraceae bacterium]